MSTSCLKFCGGKGVDRQTGRQADRRDTQSSRPVEQTREVCGGRTLVKKLLKILAPRKCSPCRWCRRLVRAETLIKNFKRQRSRRPSNSPKTIAGIGQEL